MIEVMEELEQIKAILEPTTVLATDKVTVLKKYIECRLEQLTYAPPPTTNNTKKEETNAE